jgi:hypothetical protein
MIIFLQKSTKIIKRMYKRCIENINFAKQKKIDKCNLKYMKGKNK